MPEQEPRSYDPRELLARSPMSAAQIAAVAVTVGLNALDGYDVLAISFAAPGIARQWGLDRAALGVVLSMELIGMGVGSILLGRLADKIGRRRLLLGCLLMMALGLTMATQSNTIVGLSAWRVLTGLGIGGLLASITAVAAEFSNLRRRSMNVSIMAIGYPVGAVLGGSIAAVLLKYFSWHSVFWFGAGITALFIPLVVWFIPESIEWLCQIQPPNALATINRGLKRMGHAPIATLPAPAGPGRQVPGEFQGSDMSQVSGQGIFGQSHRRLTILISLAYFLHIISFYFVVKWVPKIVVDMGFTAAAAAGVLVWVNIGGALGGATLGLLSLRWPIKYLTMAVLVMSTVMLMVFGGAGPDLLRLKVICAFTGFFTNAGIVGLYGVLAQAFPARLRATGTGFAVGFGRAGSVLAPIASGFLFHAGFGLEFVSIAMGAGSMLGAAAVACVSITGSETSLRVRKAPL